MKILRSRKVFKGRVVYGIIKAVIKNQDGKKISRAKIEAGVLP